MAGSSRPCRARRHGVAEVGGSITHAGGAKQARLRASRRTVIMPRLPAAVRRGIVASPSVPSAGRGREVAYHMNVVERATARGTEARPSRRPASSQAARGAAPPAGAARRAKLRPLVLLLPYVRRYRGRALAAFVRAAGGGAGDAGGAARGAPHDRFRLHARKPQPDRQLFRRDDRGRGRARAGERARATTSSPRSASASSPTCAARCSPTSRALSVAFFDQAKTGEIVVAAHRRHHPDQGRGRRPRCRSRCATSCCSSAPPP